ncbi:oxidized low-density lipoprotein receptor 1-like [Alligator sinensis]|uniref:Oxidized low-density lipoprotein receptor 1-like n=1 Tax=Alligator sinensis TaxID=38654 RepID=A0A3Q0FUP2_ALLSI|nr:oxidized low-density lipoprotein receptor 1-like [Alligator sinensis]
MITARTTSLSGSPCACSALTLICIRTLQEMAEEVTYADLRFMTLEQPRKQELHGANTKDAPTPSPYWRIVAVILGIFCLGFMATAGVLVVKFTQVSHLMSEREVQENLTQQLELLQAQNLNLSETLEQLASSRGFCNEISTVIQFQFFLDWFIS